MPKNIAGQKFGRLTVIEPTEEVRNGKRMWLCWCECGNEKRIVHSSLTSGRTKSCGCLRAEMLATRTRTHGDTNSREYKSWQTMKRRCNTPTCRGYSNYGGRGITVCKRWQNSYANFLIDMGRRPGPHHTLDRINNNGNYTPKNCRWATRADPMQNTRKTIHVEIDGEARTLSEWLELFGIKRKTYEMRISKGWARVEALSRPVRKYGA